MPASVYGVQQGREGQKDRYSTKAREGTEPGCRALKRVASQSQDPALLSWMNLSKMSRPCLLNCKVGSVVSSKEAWYTFLSYSAPTQDHLSSRLLFLNSAKQQKRRPP